MARTVLNLPNQQVTIEGYEQLRFWLDEEYNRWAWLQNANRPNVFNVMNSHIEELRRVVEVSRAQGQPIDMAADAVVSRFADGPLVYSASVEGEQIILIRDKLGFEAAATAFGYYRQLINLNEVRGLDVLRGLMQLAFPAMVPANEIVADLSRERAALRRASKEAEHEADLAEAIRQRALRAGLWKGARRLVRALRATKYQLKSLDETQKDRLASVNTAFDAAVDSFRKTETAYKEQMRLQAPVTYWSNKAGEHKKHEGQLKAWVIGYFIVTIPAVIFAFGIVGGWLVGIGASGGKVDSALYVVAGAGLAAVTTLVLWAGRLLMRFYLSQNHLYHDANDRSVMTSTYLALTSVGHADEKDRAIILAALFRPTADGIVKDDAAPDIGLGGVISKALVGNRT